MGMYNELSNSQLEILDSICERFEEAMHDGASTEPLEVWIEQAPSSLQDVLLSELIAIQYVGQPDTALQSAERQCLKRFPRSHEVVTTAFQELRVESERSDKIHLDAPDATHPLPEKIAGFQIEREIGRGGMGVVYLAEDLRLKRTVAVKVLHAASYASQLVKQRFLQEAETAARLQLENVVRVYEAGEHDGFPYMAMEYVDGTDLGSFLGGQPLPPKQAAACLKQLALAMHEAHQQGIVHRDLKPGNILIQTKPMLASASSASNISGDGFSSSIVFPDRAESAILKISDFGLAKDVSAGSNLTVTGAVLGTPQFMSPEQADGKNRETGPTTDVYALGAILYFLLTGRPPFLESTPVATLLAVQRDEVLPPRALVANIPQDVETICLRCLQKRPERRFPSALLLAEELERFLSNQPILSRPIGRLQRGWRWCQNNATVASLVACVFGVMALGIATTTWKWRESTNSNRTLLVTQGALKKETVAARQATEKAQAADGIARRERDNSRLRESALTLEKGLEYAESGEVNIGLAWMLNALQSLPVASEYQSTNLRRRIDAMERVIRTNLNAWAPYAIERLLVHDHQLFLDNQREVLLKIDGSSVLEWDLAMRETPKHVVELPHEPLRVWFDRQQQYLVSLAKLPRGSSWRSEMHAWNTKTGKLIGEINRFPGLPERVDCLIANRGRVLTRLESFVHVWDLKAGQHIAGPGSFWGKTLCLLDDGEFFSDSQSIWNTDTLDEIDPQDQRPHHFGRIHAPETRSRIQLEALREGDQQPPLELVDVPTGAVICSLDEWRSQELSLQRQGELVLVEEKGKAGSLINPVNGQRVLRLPPRIDYQQLSRTGQVTVTADGMYRLPERLPPQVDDDRIGRFSARLPPVPRDQIHATFSPSGELAVVPSGENLLVLSRATGSGVCRPLIQPYMLQRFAISHDDSMIATAIDHTTGIGGTVVLWNAASGQVATEPIVHTGTIGAVSFLPDDQTLVVGDQHGNIRFWDVRNATETRPALHVDGVPWSFQIKESQLWVGTSREAAGQSSVTILDLRDSATPPIVVPCDSVRVVLGNFVSDGGELLALADHSFYLLDDATGTRRLVWQTGVDQRIRLWAQQRNLVAACTQASEVSVFDLAERRLVGPPIRSDDEIVALAFGHQGSVLATASARGQVQFRDVQTGVALGPLLNVNQPIAGLHFDKSSNQFSMVATNGLVLHWSIADPIEGGVDVIGRQVNRLSGYQVNSSLQLQTLSPDHWPSVDSLSEKPATGESNRMFGPLPSPNQQTLERLTVLNCAETGNFPAAFNKLSQWDQGWDAQWFELVVAIISDQFSHADAVLQQLRQANGNEPAKRLSGNLFQLGLLCTKEKQWQRAKWCWGQLSKLDPDDWAVTRELASAVSALTGSEQSEPLWNRAGEICNDPVWLPWFAGLEFRRKKLERAATFYRRFFETHCFDINHAKRFAQLLLTLGADEEYGRFIKQRLKDWVPIHRQYDFHDNRRHIWLSCLGPIDPEDQQRVLQLAQHIAQTEESEQMTPVVRSTFAVALLRAGKLEAAIELLHNRPETSADAYAFEQDVILARAHFGLGRKSAARQIFQSIGVPTDVSAPYPREATWLYLELQALLGER